MEDSIAELLQSGVVKAVNYTPHCINLLIVVYRKCKKHLCLDLSRTVNPLLNNLSNTINLIQNICCFFVVFIVVVVKACRQERT